MDMAQAIAERAVGQYPLSIATSLAIESACGIHPDIIVESAPILQFQQLWVNMRTLFRNLMGALDQHTANGVLPPLISETLATEMDTITSIISVQSQGKAEVVFYYSNYAGLEHKYKHAVLRMDNTAKQKEFTGLHNATMKIALEEYGERIHGFDLKIKPDQHVKVLLNTHYAYDLLSWPEFAQLVLLESHTGAVKERAQWYTKYYNGQELAMIPFREDFLQVFGDHQTFRPMDRKLREAVLEVANRYSWTAVTTRAKIVYGIDQIQNPYFRSVLHEMLV